MIELLDHIPRSVATAGRYAREVFTREGRLRHIHRLNFWPLDRVLEEKYKLPREEVRREPSGAKQGNAAGRQAGAGAARGPTPLCRAPAEPWPAGGVRCARGCCTWCMYASTWGPGMPGFQLRSAAMRIKHNQCMLDYRSLAQPT